MLDIEGQNFEGNWERDQNQTRGDQLDKGVKNKGRVNGGSLGRLGQLVRLTLPLFPMQE